jgi:cytochrome P450
VLRLAPIASATTRIALRDTIVDNVPIRRGQTVLIALSSINKDSRYWRHADPKEFVPERFLGEDKNHSACAFLPFGGGHRACIGQELARFELKLIIIRLMQRSITFDDTPANTGGYEEQLTCYPKVMAVRVHFD